MWSKTRETLIKLTGQPMPVILADAGIHFPTRHQPKWIPAFAGMTIDQRFPGTVIGGVLCLA